MDENELIHDFKKLNISDTDENELYSFFSGTHLSEKNTDELFDFFKKLNVTEKDYYDLSIFFSKKKLSDKEFKQINKYEEFPLRKKIFYILFNIFTLKNTIHIFKYANYFEQCIYNYSIEQYYKYINQDYKKNMLNKGYIKKYIDKDMTYTIKQSTHYTQKARHIILNLNPFSYVNKEQNLLQYIKYGNNVLLLDKVISGKFKIQDIVFNLKPWDLKPDIWKGERSQIEIYSIIDEKDIPDGLYKCGKCKQYKTKYVELQTSRGDEATTKKVVCLLCGKRWRVY